MQRSLCIYLQHIISKGASKLWPWGLRSQGVMGIMQGRTGTKCPIGHKPPTGAQIRVVTRTLLLGEGV